MTSDIEDVHRFVNHPNHVQLLKEYGNFREKYPNINTYVLDIIDNVRENNITSIKEFNKLLQQLSKIHKIKPRNSVLLVILKDLYSKYIIDKNTFSHVKELLVSKNSRSLSGILEVAIMTSPGRFSCNENCYFCPDQKGMPRSYIKEEPAVRRAAQHNFDTVLQMYNRLSTYCSIGHNIDKLEIIVLGGTWSNYPTDYQEEFMRDIYYAANTFFVKRTERYTLEREKEINESTLCKIIGMTIETRPDSASTEEIKRLLSYGVTRVQIGVQTTNDMVLKKINRGCYTKDTIKAIHMFKDAGFKVLVHLMQNLPNATPETDINTFYDFIFKSDFQVDEWKIYPTSVTTTSEKDDSEVYTVIEKWFREGKYVPYSNEKLMEVIIFAKLNVKKHVRISRIFRDIPINNITGGADIPHLRQVVQKKMETDYHKYCKCIRCREIKSTNYDPKDVYYDVIQYEGSKNTDFFISANIESNENEKNEYKSTLIGFVRLRLKHNIYTAYNHCKEIEDCGLVRELHVYGRMNPTYLENDDVINIDKSQHKGVGKTLMNIAEKITYRHGINKVAVISGVGVRNYYRKLGYHLEGPYMVKQLCKYNIFKLYNDYGDILVNILYGMISYLLYKFIKYHLRLLLRLS